MLWLQIQTGSQVHVCLVPNSVPNLTCIMRQDTYSLISIQNPQEQHLFMSPESCKEKSTNTCQEALLLLCCCSEVQEYNKMSHSDHIKTKIHFMIKQVFVWVETEMTWEVPWQCSSTSFLISSGKERWAGYLSVILLPEKPLEQRSLTCEFQTVLCSGDVLTFLKAVEN